MIDINVTPRSTGVMLVFVVIAQLIALVALSAAPAQQIVQAGATSPAVQLGTSTTIVDNSVFADHLVTHTFSVQSRIPVAEVQARFAAPVVHSPLDLVRYDPAFNLIREQAIARWGEAEWQYLDTLIMHESRYDPRAVNPSSGACGIFQSLPCSKMPGIDWRSQVMWGLDYLTSVYGMPSAAWQHWVSKSQPCKQPDTFNFVYCNGWY